MKKLDTTIALNFIALLGAMIVISCNSPVSSEGNKQDLIIDSLIQSEKLNDKTILIRFGGEAVTAILSEKGIVVIDAGISTGLTSRYRKLIEKEFQSNDFAYLFLTHGHHDHYGGSSVFKDAKIVAHENCRNAIASRWSDPEKVKSNLIKIIGEYDKEMDTLEYGSSEWLEDFMLKARFQFSYEDIMNNRPAEMPDSTFSDSMNIRMGDATFQMIWFGKAHSNSDILIFVPELKMLFTGDLFSKYGRPSIDNIKGMDKQRTSRVIGWTEARLDNIDIVVGGHGQILTKDDLQSFFRKINEQRE